VAASGTSLRNVELLPADWRATAEAWADPDSRARLRSRCGVGTGWEPHESGATTPWHEAATAQARQGTLDDRPRGSGRGASALRPTADRVATDVWLTAHGTEPERGVR
jgi:hypothetical protein